MSCLERTGYTATCVHRLPLHRETESARIFGVELRVRSAHARVAPEPGYAEPVFTRHHRVQPAFARDYAGAHRCGGSVHHTFPCHPKSRREKSKKIFPLDSCGSRHSGYQPQLGRGRDGVLHIQVSVHPVA